MHPESNGSPVQPGNRLGYCYPAVQYVAGTLGVGIGAFLAS